MRRRALRWLRTRVDAVVRAAVDDAVARSSERTTRQLTTVQESVDRLEHRLRHDVGLAMDGASVRASAELVLTEMSRARPQVTPLETLLLALDAAPAEGMVLEFGVASGASLREIAARRAGRAVYGFDVFTGLPEDWRPGFDGGAFAQDTLPEVDGAELVVGLFDQTLPGFVAEHPGTVAFLHCDADLYSSTVTVLEHVGPRLRGGSVVLFDEYFNYPWWQEHEHRAWLEWTGAHGVAFEYIAFTWEGEQVAVRVLSTPWDDEPGDAADSVPRQPHG